jgi:histone deacetylase complex regulatory component SIN3
MDKRVDYAKKFLHLVRKKFTEGSTKYEEFLQIMKSFKDQK